MIDTVQSMYYSLKEVAKILNVSTQTARKIIEQEKLYIKIGSIIRVEKDNFHRYLKKLEKNSC